MNNKKYYWLTDESRLFLERGYLKEGQTAEQRVREIANHAEKLTGIKGFANTFEDYMSRGWFSLSSPVWANYGMERGLPVSCFGSYIEDDMASILETLSEVGMLSKFGGGTSGFFGALRPRGAPIKDSGASHGSVHFMKLYDELTNTVSQGSVRRGFFSGYLPIEHADFDEFVGIGSDGHPIQNITHGVTVTDKFMNDMIGGDKKARRRWAKVIETRSQVGYPYIFWTDTVNNEKPDCFKDHQIYASNMCTEIALPSSDKETFVCVLSSMNLLHWDEWKDTNAVEVLTIFLDSVCEEFLLKAGRMFLTNNKAYDKIRKAVDFCRNWRALGLGVLGWHSYLQSKMIPFESKEANELNIEIFIKLKIDSLEASRYLADKDGMSEGMKEHGRKNATLLAVAPTKSSSFILGDVSQGIEPEFSNFYIKDLAKIKVTKKNKYLENTLDKLGFNTEDVWASIKDNDGSVQHLDFLPQEVKDVFKTFNEIDPYTVIEQACSRQHFIDQAQSINLVIDSSWTAKDINKLYIEAWSKGIKTLYYQYGFNAAQTKKREKNKPLDCIGCQA